MSGWGNDDTSGGGDSEGATGGEKKGCFKCGEEGHMSRDCPTGGGGADGGACRKCGKEGHFAKDCELPDKCFKCKQEGHKSADCELPDTCFKCKKEGHMAADCELPDTCRKCKKEGHMARDCELPDVCHNCGEEGHMSKDCSKPQLCKRCGEEGHMVRECTQEEKTRQMTDEEGKIREIYVPKAEEDEGKLFENAITSGINFNKFENIPVKVTGENPPSAISSFSSAGLRPVLMENIEKSGYRVPTPVQKRCLPIVMSGRDLMSCAQTGSGKTAAFLLPVLHKLIEGQADNNAGAMVHTPQCVVITPTRELAMQIKDEARKIAMGSIASICGMQSRPTNNGRQNDRGGCLLKGRGTVGEEELLEVDLNLLGGAEGVSGESATSLVILGQPLLAPVNSGLFK